MKFRSLIAHFRENYMRFIRKYYGLTIAVYILTTLFLGYHALKIELRTDFLELLPEKNQNVQNLKKTIEYYGGDGYLIGVAEWNSPYKKILPDLKDLGKNTENLAGQIRSKGSLSSEIREPLQDLIRSYQQQLIWVNQQKQSFPNERFLDLLSKEFEIIIKETSKKAADAFQKTDDLEILSALLNSLEDNRYAFEQYAAAIRAEKGGKEALIQFAEEFSTRLEKEQDLIRYVEFKFQTNYIKDHLLYFLSPSDLAEIKTKIQDKINYERRKRILSSSLFMDEPVTLDFSDIIKKNEKSTRVLKVSKSTDFFAEKQTQYDYYLNENEDMLLFLIKPAKSSTDVGFSDILVSRAENISQELLKKYPGELSMGYTGRYVKRIEDARIIKKDLQVISLVAMGLILLSVYFHFRKIRAVIIVGSTLISALVWSTGIISLTIGYFNIITGFLLAILTGLGVNFGINMFARYVEERDRGMDIFQSLNRVFQTTLMSNITATVTTVAAFSALIFSQFKGFSQFGFAAALGMLLLFADVLLSYSSVIIISDKIFPMKPRPKREKLESFKGKRIPFYRWIFLGAAAFSIFSIFTITQSRFNANFYDLAAQNTLAKKLEKKAESLIKMSLWPVVIYASDWETMQTVTRHIQDLKDQGQLETLDKVDSLSNYLPEKQDEKKILMKEIRDLLNDSVLDKLKNPEEHRKVARLKEMTESPEVKGIQEVPHEISRQFQGTVPGYFIFYYPKFNLSMSNSKTVRAMSQDIQKIDSYEKKSQDAPIMIASDAMIFTDVLDLIAIEGPVILFLLFFAIYFFLWLDFRSFKKVLLVLVPLIVGVLWIFGFSYLFHWQFNYFNIIMFPIILGICIDYGVHFYHRYLEEGPNNIYYVSRTQGKAIFIGAFTDLLGFGSLIFALYKGLATMGYVAIAGIASCGFSGILLMGCILEFRKDVKQYGWKKALTGRGISQNVQP